MFDCLFSEKGEKHQAMLDTLVIALDRFFKL